MSDSSDPPQQPSRPDRSDQPVWWRRLYDGFVDRFHPGADATRDERIRATAKLLPITLAIVVIIGGIIAFLTLTLRSYVLLLGVDYLGLGALTSYIGFVALLMFFAYALMGESIAEPTPLRWIVGALVGVVVAALPVAVFALGYLQPEESAMRALRPALVVFAGIILCFWNIHRYRATEFTRSDLDSYL